MTTSSIAPLSAALEYALRGYSVFPCVPGQKVPLTANGFKAATTDAEQIRRWWADHPDANIGLPTAGLMVVDIDGADNGWGGPDLLNCPVAVTPRGGRHLLFRQPTGRQWRNTTSALAPHVDTRADGGYIVVEPSIVNGRLYQWDGKLCPRADLPAPPPWLIDALDALANPKAAPPNGNGHHHVGTLPRYVQVALDAEVGKVSTATEGERNALLNKAAYAPGTLVGGGQLDRAYAEERLAVAAQRCGLEPGETERTINSGIEKGILKPRGRNGQNNAAPSTNGTASKQQPAKADAAPDAGLTDVGNGVRLIARHGNDLRYCRPWRKWVCWNGVRWRVDNTVSIDAKAKETVIALFEEAQAEIAVLKKELEQYAGVPEDIPPEQKRRMERVKALLKWAVSSQFANRIAAMITMATSEPGIPILPEAMDTDPWLLNCTNGTLELRTGTLRPHERGDRLTKICPVVFDPNAECPIWHKFLFRIMDGNHGLVDYLRRAVGYSMSGSVREQCLFFLHGSGANGKSTFLGALLAVLADYGMQTISELLTARSGDAHPTERADLFGRRLVATTETEDGRRMAEALVKQLTGGDRIRARRMREDFWEFDPTHKIWLAANHKPVIRGTDYAIWRRIKLIPFNVTIGDGEKDPLLLDKLKAEAAGILAWAVGGCLEWQRLGLADPQEVVAATAEYRAEQDILADFLSECCVTGPGYRVKAGELYTRFQAWCKASGEKEMGKKRFGIELEGKGYERFISNGNWYRGLAVRVEATGGVEAFEPFQG